MTQTISKLSTTTFIHVLQNHPIRIRFDDLLSLMPLSAIFQLYVYHGEQF